METEKKTNTLGYFREIFKNPKDLLTIPNMLVYLRVLLSILFLATYIGGVNVTFADHVWHWGILSPEEIDAGVGFQIEGYIACACILTCGFTDFLDGYIARKFNQQTELGVLLDPVADKLLQLFIIVGVCCRWAQITPMVWVLLAVLIAKEGTMLFGDLIIIATRNIRFHKAYWYGKMSTLVLYLTMGIMLFFVNVMRENLFLFINILCAICTATLIFAWFMYTLKYVDMYRHPEKYRQPAEKK